MIQEGGLGLCPGLGVSEYGEGGLRTPLPARRPQLQPAHVHPRPHDAVELRLLQSHSPHALLEGAEERREGGEPG